MRLRRNVSGDVTDSPTILNYNLTVQELPQYLNRSEEQQCICFDQETEDLIFVPADETLDIAQCADFALHISLVVFLTVMIVSCV